LQPRLNASTPCRLRDRGTYPINAFDPKLDQSLKQLSALLKPRSCPERWCSSAGAKSPGHRDFGPATHEHRIAWKIAPFEASPMVTQEVE
jgi:hypothetical protein